MENNVFIFRIDFGNKLLKKEIEKGRLRQGWGMKGMGLLDEDGNERSFEDWNKTYYWNDEEKNKKRRYENLRIMLKMKEGDLIIVPKFPEYNQMTVLKVKSGYKFLSLEEHDDFGHVIEVDYSNSKKFNYKSKHKECSIIYSRLRGYQRAVNNVWNNEIKNAAKKLITLESDVKDNELTDNFKKVLEEKMEYLKGSFKNYRPNDIEKIVEKIFKNQGYELESRNYYDKKGGDADLIFRRSLPVLEEISDEINREIPYYRIYVQVKKRDGEIDYNRLEGLNQLNDIVKTDLKNREEKEKLEEKQKENIYKILVSTGNFSDEVIKKAKESDIILIDGKQLARLAIKYL